MGLKPRTRSFATARAVIGIDERATADALEKAPSALRQSKPAEALEHLLIGWRASRLPAIATLIDQLSARIASLLDPIDGDLEGLPFHNAWMEVAARMRAIDVALLCPG